MAKNKMDYNGIGFSNKNIDKLTNEPVPIDDEILNEFKGIHRGHCQRGASRWKCHLSVTFAMMCELLSFCASGKCAWDSVLC